MITFLRKSCIIFWTQINSDICLFILYIYDVQNIALKSTCQQVLFEMWILNCYYIVVYTTVQKSDLSSGLVVSNYMAAIYIIQMKVFSMPRSHSSMPASQATEEPRIFGAPWCFNTFLILIISIRFNKSGSYLGRILMTHNGNLSPLVAILKKKCLKSLS